MCGRGGSVQAWPDQASGQRRADYITAIANGLPAAVENDTVRSDGLLFRVAGAATPDQAQKVSAAVEAMHLDRPEACGTIRQRGAVAAADRVDRVLHRLTDRCCATGPVSGDIDVPGRPPSGASAHLVGPTSYRAGCATRRDEPCRLPVACAGCGHRWYGIDRAHRAACHRTFADADFFDRHRGESECRNPASLGMIKHVKSGLWEPRPGKPGAPADRHRINRAIVLVTPISPAPTSSRRSPRSGEGCRRRPRG
jgi:hypothetical protein